MLCKQIEHVDGVPTCTLCGRTWNPNNPPPYYGKCQATRSRGLGDVVAKSLLAAGVKKGRKCKPCQRRQAALNELVPRRWWDNAWAAVRAMFSRRKA